MTVRLKETYEVDQEHVFVSVSIGEGQKGHTTVYLDSAEVASGKNIVREDLGRGPDLEGKELRIASAVLDKNENTNKTSVIYELEGGPEPGSFKLEYEVHKHGEQVDYYAKFRLL